MRDRVARLWKSQQGVVVPVVLAAFLHGYHLWWGLPNGNATWSVDALQPVTPLAVLHASFTQGWNSGWFYYKYPIGHALLLGILYLPYLGVLWLTGGWTAPSTSYPYGFADPEQALFVLAMIARTVSLLMGIASAVILFRICRRLLGVTAARWSTVAVVASPAVVFYAHTSNLDLPCLFWMVLAWELALRAHERPSRNVVLGFGAACGMALATKEQAAGWLVGLSLMIAAAHVRGRMREGLSFSTAAGRLVAGAAVGVLVLLLASNALYNPSGFYHRWAFLTDTLAPEVRERFAPRAPFLSLGLLPTPAAVGEAVTVVAWSMGLPWFAFSLCGFVACLKTARVAVPAIAVPVLGYYFLSVAPLPDVTVRYLLPATLGVALFGGAMCEALWSLGRAARVLAAFALGFTLVQGAGVDYLLANDPRYQVENWLETNVAPGARIETYHKATHLPRRAGRGRFERPPFDRINRRDFGSRSPDLVLINLRDTDGITGRYDKLEPRMVRQPENVEFLNALVSGELGYTPVRRFHLWWPLLPEGLIPSLNPPLVLFARQRVEADRHGGFFTADPN
jgi:4-amino-4-deoxy-L-arabinose transferase-like glycosyltransferase